MGDRFDEVSERAEHESVARELKFLVTDMNGWQTAYGYAGGDLRARFVASAAELRRELELAGDELTDEREQPLLEPAQRSSSTGSWSSTRSPGASSRPDNPEETKRILLGPELRRFEAMAATAEELADYEAERGDRHRGGLRRRARRCPAAPDRRRAGRSRGDHPAAGHRERHRPHGARGGTHDPRPQAARDARRRILVTQDVLLTLSLLLGAALAARFVASLLRVPEILLLVLVGALFGPSALDVVDVPLDSIGAQLLFTLGVSMILFYGGLNLSVDVLQRVWVGLGMLVIPGVLLTAVITGVVAHLAFDLSWTAALLMGAVLAPTDPAILIPLFVRSRLRPKVAQTVVAESAFNDPDRRGAGAGARGRPAERRRVGRDAGPRVRRRPRRSAP